MILALMLVLAAEEGRIMRPANQAAYAQGPVDVVATAPEARMELDGKPVTLETPFPQVLHGKISPAAGVHKLALIWADGRTEVTFYVGDKPPAGFTVFRTHPPAGDVACTQCHELSKRGRFRFKGGCMDCHDAKAFAAGASHKPHTHQQLAECGMCHNAHGSTVKAHLNVAKDAACKQCHGQ